MASDFMELYLEYTSEQESPEQFHFWAGVTMVGALLGRSVWLEQGIAGHLFPNHYVVLVAASALARKSTSFANIAVPRVLRPTLRELSELHLAAGCARIMATKITPEKILEELDKQKAPHGESSHDYTNPNVALFYSSELGVFLSKAAQLSGVTEILMDLYDNPDFWDYQTKTSGEYHLRWMCASLIGATTPNWIANNISSEGFNQGMIGRTIWVFGHGPKALYPRLVYTSQHARLEGQMVKRMRELSYLYGPYTFGAGAGEFYDDWYRAREEPAIDDGGFFGREHTHVLKLAMVLAACRRHERVIMRRDITDAIDQLNIIRAGLPLVFRESFQSHESSGMRFVESIVREYGPIPRSELLKRVYRRMHQKELDEYLNTLMLAGVIDRDKAEADGPGRRASIYRLAQGEKDGRGT